ncbi:cysteine-rich protein 1 [Folsomia candida]|uniref:Cysteine-rich protein 1 n=1 Tax=Folsomia candida TaxID=158441 RepID=A0A226ES50_FOLCA|nr:cysteine-rich protein 1 [Folsomia candida]OXA60048.1 Cysteine-rich protein 1 [Folsomia candida]
MPNCPKCEKPVYFAERKSSLGKDWHSACLRCERCNKTLTPGSHAEHDNKPYCNRPCYAVLFGPTGYGRGGVAESFVYNSSPSANAPPAAPQVVAQAQPQATN